jgi:hypothetical protein
MKTAQASSQMLADAIRWQYVRDHIGTHTDARGDYETFELKTPIQETMRAKGESYASWFQREIDAAIALARP